MMEISEPDRAEKLAAAKKKLKHFQKKKTEEDFQFSLLHEKNSQPHHKNPLVLVDGNPTESSKDDSFFFQKVTTASNHPTPVQHIIDDPAFSHYPNGSTDKYFHSDHMHGSETKGEVETDYQNDTLGRDSLKTQNATKLSSSDSSLHSSTEKLRQLTQKLTDLVRDPTLEGQSRQALDLANIYKKRSVELTQKLEEKSVEMESLCREFTKMKGQLGRLQSENDLINSRFSDFQTQIQKSAADSVKSIANEKETLSLQLKKYSQAMEIVVGEKSELQKTIADLQNQISALADQLEKSKSLLVFEKDKNAHLQQKISQVESHTNTQLDFQEALMESKITSENQVSLLNDQIEQLSHENHELLRKLEHQMDQTEKLKSLLNQASSTTQHSLIVPASVPENAHQTTDREIIVQLKNQMAELSNEKEILQENLEQSVTNLEILQSEKHENEKHLLQDAQMIANLQKKIAFNEKEISGHQETIQSLNQEILKLKTVVKDLNDNISLLSNSHQNLQSSSPTPQPDQKTSAPSFLSESSPISERQTSPPAEALYSQISDLGEKLSLGSQLNEELKALVLKQAHEIVSLESRIERFQKEESEKVALLEKVRSDAETISRATAQNRQLKDQLMALQDRIALLSAENSHQPSFPQNDANPHHSQHLLERIHQLETQLQAFQASPSRPPVSQEADSVPSEDVSSGSEKLTQDSKFESQPQFSASESDDKKGCDQCETLDRMNSKLKQEWMIMKDLSDELSAQKESLLKRLFEEEKISNQLSLEVETIGEYVVLYQNQRMALKTKIDQKESFILNLKRENSQQSKRIGDLEQLLFEIYQHNNLHRRISNGANPEWEPFHQTISQKLMTIQNNPPWSPAAQSPPDAKVFEFYHCPNCYGGRIVAV